MSIKTIHVINSFWQIDHKWTKIFVKNEIFQIVQIIVFISTKPQLKKIKKKIQHQREKFLKYLSKWIIDKSIFRKTLTIFWMKTKTYKNSNQFHNFVFKFQFVESKNSSQTFQSNKFSQIIVFTTSFFLFFVDSWSS